MTITTNIQANTLNLSARQLKALTREAGAEWSDELINDYLGQLSGLLVVSGSVDQVIPRIESLEMRMNVVEGRLDSVEIRVDDVEFRLDVLEPRVDANEISILNNALAIAQNASDIAINADNITLVTNNFNTHNSSSSQHGVTGNNVGTGDFCTTSVGGVVELMALVADAIQSTQTIALPDIAAAPAAYDQAHIQTLVDMANDTKAKHNQLVTDFNNAVTQLNELIDNSKTAKQMSTT